MKINKVILENFKSFFGKHEIDFDDNISFLLGLNGSGKSNFLNSLNFLNSNIKDDYKLYVNSDFFKIERNVKFSVGLNLDYSKNIDALLNAIHKNVLSIVLDFFINKVSENSWIKKLVDPISIERFLLTIIEKILNKNLMDFSNILLLKSVIDNKSYSKIYINLINENKFNDYWSNNFYKMINNKIFLKSFWKENVKEYDLYFDNDFYDENIDEYSYLTEEEKKHSVIKFHREINEDIEYLLTDSMEKWFKRCVIDIDNKKYIEISVANFDDLLTIIYWQYSDDMIIPDTFLINKIHTNLPLPLKNIFEYLNKDINNIREEVKEVSSQSKLNDELNNKINKLLETTWPDFSNKDYHIDFKISENKIITTIKNKDMYNHKEIRIFSDGYKQFLSILFSVGISNLNNKIILLDEPEIHLHPSSILSLRKKIIDMANKNNLSHTFISTHSINMIDRSYLNYYYILDTKEITTTDNTNSISSFIEKVNKKKEMPAIIKQAMGVDFFSDFLYRKNCILVEGIIDKKILDEIFKNNKIDCSTIISYGTQADSHFDAIKENFGTNFFNNNLYILLDSDQSGKNQKKRYIEEFEFNKDHIFLLDELLGMDNNEEIEIEYFYNDVEYDKYKTQKSQCKKNDLKCIKEDFLKRNIDSLNQKKVIIFLDNLRKKMKDL